MRQNEALAILKTGANVFLTGEPGSGKTHTVNEYVAYLRSCGIGPAITASTGIAATHIGGSTIHSWSGIGVKHDLTKHDIERIGSNKNVTRRVADAHILIIDEVSMLSSRSLSMVDTVCRTLRSSEQPFGGLQVVLVGDFFQLPPVSAKAEHSDEGGMLTDSVPDHFAFFSPAWSALDPVVCYLSEQHRQEDAAFLGFLSAVRRAAVAEEHKQLLRTRYSPKPQSAETQLYSHNADVDAINRTELEKLSGKQKQFPMTGHGPERLVASLKRGCLSPDVLALKVGARVMFTKNDVTTHRYANGTLGEVVRFETERGLPLVKTRAGRTILAEPDEWRVEESGRVLARIAQVPLRLAWAITVHKSQGMSLDAAHMDLSRTFEYGQGYVALSRVRTLAGLSLAGLNQRALEVHPDILASDAAFRTHSAHAREKLTTTLPAELTSAHQQFLTRCGGKPGAGQRHPSAVSKPRVSTHEKTLVLLKQKQSIAQIAEARGVAHSTILSHLEQLKEKGTIDMTHDLSHLKKPKGFAEMKRALEAARDAEGVVFLAPARAIVGERYSYEELRLVRLFL